MTAAAPPNGAAGSAKAAYESAEARPPTLPVQPDGIPTELRTATDHHPKGQWVCWRWERRDGKWTKVPVNPDTRENAKPNDPKTWGDFGQALTRCQREADRYAGLGFVFSPADPFCGVDLDDARDPTTGDISPWAVELLDALGGYAEVSPSGTGVKAVVRAVKPPGRCQGQYQGHKVEIYDRGRFFALTGHALPDSPAEVPERQEALEALCRRVFPERAKDGANGRAKANGEPHGNGQTGFKGEAHGKRSEVWEKPYDQLTDDDILTLASEAKNRRKFAALWQGDTSGHQGDDSRADAALCAILAYWCRKGAKRIDALFRRSGLMRPKWDEVHSGEGLTYGEMTVGFAVEVCAEVYPGPRPKKRRKGKRKGRAERPGAGPDGGGQDGEIEEPVETVPILVNYFRQRYNPIFRRGEALYSARLGREVKKGEATWGAPSELVEQLLDAVDGPGDRDEIQHHFREWSKTAWLDLLDTLPEEEATTREWGVSDQAADEFTGAVRGALLELVPLAYTYKPADGPERTEVQRRPLIEWARMFAASNGERWGSVRGYRIWSKLDKSTPPRVMVAVRVELFRQLHYADLARMKPGTFTKLCRLYGVGLPCKVTGGDDRAVRLSAAFLGDLMDCPADETAGDGADGQEPSPAPAREEQPSNCPGSGEGHAPQ